MQIYKDKWEESYTRYENHIFFPKEEVVKFLNRFIRKKIGPKEFADKLDFSKTVRGLDLGCGIGSNTLLMHEFGIEAYGVDISAKAVETAQDLAKSRGIPESAVHFQVVDGVTLPFADNYFDVLVCDSVLDSMSFEIALQNMREINRITSRFAFFTLISGDDSEHYREFAQEEIVETTHEQGTVQCYYNFSKIRDLVKASAFQIKWCHLIKDISVLDKNVSSRYFVVLEKPRT
ncbi:MAG: class I SAM-dependent methyltransferase [Candidatus Margulisbacteria bacterium]|nr:class I SAM-dependent methyltransferase [Candidatus Margulisiibacteriota bacterium]